MKTKFNFFFITMVSAFIVMSCSHAHAQSYSAKDLDGTWMRDDGMVITIGGTAMFEGGGNALVMSVGKSGWPASIEHYAFKYRGIKYIKDNTWKGTNYRHRVETNARVEDGEAIFVMSRDKKSFKASGYTYTKR